MLSGLLVLLMAAGAANAAERKEPDHLYFGGGIFNVLDDDPSAAFFGEYRFGKKIWVLNPFVGIMGTADGSLYGVGGFAYDFFVTDRLVLRPSLAAGLYWEGNGVDLGFPLEFRSDIELAYRFENRSRLAVSFHHISNASLGDRNPGTEILRIGYSFPVDKVF